MELAEVHDLVVTVAGVRPSCRDRVQLHAAVAAGARLRAWLDGRDVQLAAQLAQVASFPEQAIAQAARTSLRDAGRVLERARTTVHLPALGEALSAGAISGGHVDVIGRALRQLEPHQRRRLTARAQQLVEVAVRSTPDEFQRALAVEVRSIQRSDEIARLERQRRATRLRSWVDGEGMWCLTGRFDPETGLTLHRRLDATIATLYTDSVPDGCPSDPLERHGFLHAHALVALTHGRGGGPGRPEVVVVVDTATTPDPAGAPTIDWGLPVELPTEVLHRLFPWPTSTPSSCTEASSSTPPDNSTWDAPPAWPTGPNAAPCVPSTPPAPSPAAPPATTYANSTTSTGGNTAEPPTSTTSSRCVSPTTTPSTTGTGNSPSPPTANSPSPTPTAPPTAPDHPDARDPRCARPDGRRFRRSPRQDRHPAADVRRHHLAAAAPRLLPTARSTGARSPDARRRWIRRPAPPRLGRPCLTGSTYVARLASGNNEVDQRVGGADGDLDAHRTEAARGRPEPLLRSRRPDPAASVTKCHPP